ncbi:MAG: hypothetical protein IPK00_02490 [Deltaproteobacteria bacterium]|nr:hypothetical protein [Deltaproteobacteria bacterium]
MAIPRPLRSLVRFEVLRSLIALVALAALAGCAAGEFRPTDPFDRKLSFSESQHRYTVLIRWAEFQKARAFVLEDHREKFMADIKAFEEARFTDYESEEVDLDEEKRKATVRVTYTAYLPSSPYEVEIVEIQEWSREGMGNAWQVQSSFEGGPKVAAN